MAELTLPRMDFAPLGQLGNVYRKAQEDEQRKMTLASLGQGGDVDAQTLLKSGDLSLAQLGVAMRNRSSDDIWRLQEATRSQGNADRSFSLQSRAADRADEGPVETAAQRAKAAGAYGLTPDSPAFKPFVLTGKLPEGDTSIVQQAQQRKAVAAANGLLPDHPAYNSFILTGKMPREDAQPLTATDKKAVMEADEGVLSAQTAIDSLQKAKELSPKAFSGPLAAERGYAASFLGSTSDIGKAGLATTELDNVVKTNALSQLKAIFGGNPTEGERTILLEIQGSSKLSPEARANIYERAKQLAEVRLNFNKQRASELRGGQFYKPQGAISRAPVAPPQGAISQQQYDSLPSGTPFTAPDGSQRIKP